MKANIYAIAAATIFDGATAWDNCAVIVEGESIRGLIPRRVPDHGTREDSDHPKDNRNRQIHARRARSATAAAIMISTGAVLPVHNSNPRAP